MQYERPRFLRPLLVSAFLFGAAIGSVLPEPPAKERRAFTIEDLYRVEYPSSPRLSPAGDLVAYSLESRDLPRGTSNHDLYLVPAEGGTSTRLTFTETANETSPAFSPDGKSLAFVSDREGNSQIWLMPVDGGEARAITALSTGVSDPRWSPDGSSIAFLSEVYPECGADDACNRRLDGIREKNPLRAHVADELLYRHWNSWSTGKVGHVLIVDVESQRVRDLTPGEREAPVFTLGGAGAEFAFSPDGAELAYTRNPDPVATLAWSTNADLFVVPVAPAPDGSTQPARNITAGNPAWDGTPAYSPDGRFIAYRRQQQAGFESDLFRIALYDRRDGSTRSLATQLDNWVTAIAWSPDGGTLVARIEERGETPLYTVPLGGEAPQRVAAFAQIDELEVVPGGGAAVVNRRAVGSPPELYRLDLTGSAAPRRLTHHNAQLEREVDVRPAEAFWVEGAEGKKLQVFMVKPHGFDPARKYPVIVNVHGGPQSQWSDSFRGDWQVYPGAGFIVVFPNPHGSTGYGQAYTEAISGDWGGKVIEDVMRVVDHVESLPFVDRGRIGAMGWSWGGYAMFWLNGHTDRFKALAAMMGIYDLASEYGGTEELWFPEWEMKGTPWTSPLYEKWNPSRFADRWKTPTLIVTGELDFRVPYTESLAAFTTLRRRAIPARLIVLPKAGHWPGWYEMALYYTAHLDWFHTYLGGDGPPWSVEEFATGKVFDPETGKRREPAGGP